MTDKKATPKKAPKAITKPEAGKKPATLLDVQDGLELKVLVKKPELIANVAQRADIKKKDAKIAIEATLAAISELLEDGKDMNLPPLGKIRIVKSKDLDAGAKVFTTKIRTMKKSTLIG